MSEDTITIWGQVGVDGSVVAGDGFTSTHISRGRYQITFTRPFAHPAVVVITQNKDLRTAMKQWFDDNVITVDATAGDCIVAIRDVGQSHGYEDESFNFIAMGRPGA